MRIGVLFPQHEIGNDPGAIRAYAQGVEEMGYDRILATEHVLGGSTVNRPERREYFTHEKSFHEPFVLFGFLAAITHRVELMTSVLVLPLRQTALVAKQAAAVDVLSGGRLRLGIGVGDHALEYEALNEDFSSRGVRSVEQIEVLRELWTKPVVNFDGRWHRIDAAGINPLPVQRPIPIWLGGHSEATLKRVGRLGDGWYPLFPPGDKFRASVEQVYDHALAAGRDPSVIGIETHLSLALVPEDDWVSQVHGWRDLGATHLTINTMGLGLAAPDGHLDQLRRVLEVLER
jgi:probable F420-dependent oxidoreductase